MKFLKYSLLALFIAVITDLTLVLAAYPSPSSMSISMQLSANNGTWTQYVNKNTWSTQTYENRSTFTWLTNPCNSCQITAKHGTPSGDVGTGVVTTLGQKKSFTSPTSLSQPGDYRLYIYRNDFTLLTTYHAATWAINP